MCALVVCSAQHVHHALAKLEKERTRAVYFEIVQYNGDIPYGRDHQITLENEMNKLVADGDEEWQQLEDHLKKQYKYSYERIAALKKTWKQLGKTFLKNPSLPPSSLTPSHFLIPLWFIYCIM